MLIKVSTLWECKDKGYSLRKQIEVEAKLLADEYRQQVRISLSDGSIQNVDLQHLFKAVGVLARALNVAKKRAWKEVAENYRSSSIK